MSGKSELAELAEELTSVASDHWNPRSPVSRTHCPIWFRHCAQACRRRVPHRMARGTHHKHTRRQSTRSQGTPRCRRSSRAEQGHRRGKLSTPSRPSRRSRASLRIQDQGQLPPPTSRLCLDARRKARARSTPMPPARRFPTRPAFAGQLNRSASRGRRSRRREPTRTRPDCTCPSRHHGLGQRTGTTC